MRLTSWAVLGATGSLTATLTFTATNALNPLAPGQEVAQLWESLRNGGVVEYENETVSVQIPVTVSSTIIPEREGGEDDEPDPTNMTIVLFGQSGPATASVILGPDLVSFIINVPGSNTIKVHVGANGLVPQALPTDASMTTEQPHDDPLGLAAIALDEFIEFVTVPEASASSVPMAHYAPPAGHSIAFSKHIHEEDMINPTDPVNAVFYHHGDVTSVEDTMRNIGWDGPDACGSAHELYMLNLMHGGTDGWRTQHADWDDEAIFCAGDRYHLRRWTPTFNDNHPAPNFQDYSVTPVHWEDGLDHFPVYPRLGQDHLLEDLRNEGTIRNIRQIVVPNIGVDECDWCGNWNGRVDFYERVGLVHADPCGGSPTYDIWTKDDPAWTRIRWKCPV